MRFRSLSRTRRSSAPRLASLALALLTTAGCAGLLDADFDRTSASDADVGAASDDGGTGSSNDTGNDASNTPSNNNNGSTSPNGSTTSATANPDLYDDYDASGLTQMGTVGLELPANATGGLGLASASFSAFQSLDAQYASIGCAATTTVEECIIYNCADGQNSVRPAEISAGSVVIAGGAGSGVVTLVPSGASGGYNPKTLDAGTFARGATLTVGASGGAFPEFEVSLRTVSDFSLYAPVIPAGSTPYSQSKSDEMVLSWSIAAPADAIAIVMVSGATQGSGASATHAFASCQFHIGSGGADIPKGVWPLLSAETATLSARVVSLARQRTNTALATAESSVEAHSGTSTSNYSLPIALH